MKSNKPTLHTALLVVLAALPVVVQAQQANIHPAIADLHTAEAPRVIRVVDDRVLTPVPHSHLALLDRNAPIGSVPDATPMEHIQLVLRRSALRQAALDGLIAAQHDRHSPKFHQWVTPEEFGSTFGVADADIAATTAWLTTHGFSVNVVYPNRMQIDFSGTAGTIRQAFHAQEYRYTIGDETHIANGGDISLPSALKDVVVGIAGLNDLRPKPLHVAERLAQFDPATGRFNIVGPAAKTGPGAKPMAISFLGGARGLVPFDLEKMYAADQLYVDGVTGKGITIAVVEQASMQQSDWYNFVSQFNLGSYGGTFAQIQPQPGFGIGPRNCTDPLRGGARYEDDGETLLDAEWATAIAPGAHIEVASCGNFPNNTSFDGVYVAATNLINGNNRPDIISASYGTGEAFVDKPSKTAIDAMWEQADAEGISVFVASGDSGSNPSFNNDIIRGYGVDANALGTSPHVTVVGGTDTADVLDGTTGLYFSRKLNADYGSALSYVPEIPWNMSCGNSVAALAHGYSNALDFCVSLLVAGPEDKIFTSEAGSGGPSAVDRKPAWQSQVFGAANDGWRDVPDVALFAGSFHDRTVVIICNNQFPCLPHFNGFIQVAGGTSLSSPMFAGIQALIDQGLQLRGGLRDQGNAAPTLYALAAQEYGTAGSTPPASLATCNADNGATGTSACVFHNLTRGGISSHCMQHLPQVATPDCYFYATIPNFENRGVTWQLGLTSTDATSYSNNTLAYPAKPGWSFAAGLGSVNANNLLSAWTAYDSIR